MDDRSFDRLARLLGAARDRRTGLKALVGGILGAGGIAALDDASNAKRKGKGDDRRRADDAEAGKKKRRKTCKPACTDGHVCQKVGKKRQCVCPTGVTCGAACCALGQTCVDGACVAAACDPPCANGYVCQGTTCTCPSGVECGGACCASGQTCENGACAGMPDPSTCIAAGQPCKAVGRACCDGRVCSSGQGGERDVACYVPKTGRCVTSADCVFGTSCADGRCAPLPGPAPTPVSQLGAACNAATDVCTSPGAVCQAYTGDVPVGLSGTYCTLPLRATCTVNPDCGCYSCDYQAGSFRNGRRKARADRAKTCCGKAGLACSATADCCEDHVCTAGGTCELDAACTVCKSGCAYDTIEEAIEDGVTDIRVGAGVYFEHDLPLPSGDKVRIRPCGNVQVTIDAQQLGRVMEPITTGKTVTIQGITVRNGKHYDVGGSFEVQLDGTLVLIDATVLGPRDATGLVAGAVYGGGCIHSAGGTLDIRGSTISGCKTALGSGGGIYSEDDFDTKQDSTVTIADSTVADSFAGSNGGGIFIEGGSPTLTNVAITGNTSGNLGGGIEFRPTAPGQQITLVDCTISGNIATGQYGAGVLFYRLYGDTSGSGMVIKGGTITGNSGPDEGGGVHARYGSLHVEGTVISGNSAKEGAGIFVRPNLGKPWFDSPDTVTITGDTLIERNKADTGGGVYFERDDKGQYVATISGSVIIRKNDATVVGGGIFFTGNRGERVTIESGVVIEENTAPRGAGLLIEDAVTPGRITIADTDSIANDNVTDRCALGGYEWVNSARTPVVVTKDCTNWCAPDNFIIDRTWDDVTDNPPACLTACCSAKPCAYGDANGFRNWYCTSN